MPTVSMPAPFVVCDPIPPHGSGHARRVSPRSPQRHGLRGPQYAAEVQEDRGQGPAQSVRDEGQEHKRQHRNAAPTCPPLCPVCQSCDPASGQCVTGNQGGVCGIQSVPRGGAIRCCDGRCPDPECRPAGDTGIACVTPADCVGINCCARQRAVFCSTTCICLGAVAGEACGSDRDCEAAAPATACICGTCQAPPA